MKYIKFLLKPNIHYVAGFILFLGSTFSLMASGDTKKYWIPNIPISNQPYTKNLSK